MAPTDVVVDEGPVEPRSSATPQHEVVSKPAGTSVRIVFTITVFLGASLLFLVEPMVAKMLLPLLGGSPAVWNTATVFFQLALLGGYAFAHLTLRGFGTRRQPVVQIAVLLVPLLTLPIAVPLGWTPPSDASPALWTLLVLTVMVGAPFFVLSTVSPTLQRWFSATTHPHAADPYFLYAAGNVGSLLALLAYPLLIEPALSLTDQARAWSILYLTFVACCVVCAVLLGRNRATEASIAIASDDADTPSSGDATTAPRSTIDNRTRIRWVALAAVPSALMLGVTRHISSDVASMPLLWVIPLALYLITFIIAFGKNPTRWTIVSGRLLKLLVVPLALSFFGLVASLWFGLGLNLAVFFCAAMVAHGRLSSERPVASKLTEFYLLLSLGGVVGGILVALLAPLIFTSVLEYPLTIVLALAVLPKSLFGDRTPRSEQEPDARPAQDLLARRRDLLVVVGVIVVAGVAVAIRSDGTQQGLTMAILVAAIASTAAYVLARSPAGYACAIGVIMAAGFLLPPNPTTFQERTFFGVHRVYVEQAQNDRHVLLNGTTVHGMEYFVGDHAHEPTSYYHPTGPVGQWFAAGDPTGPESVGVIGLGSGALAWYGQPGDEYTFYEIDQAVVDVAEDPELFTFVAESPATVSMVLGDGRLQLEASGASAYDKIVIDAFSGDAIPVHLLTDEAVALYEQHLAPDGSMAFHISNRYFDFRTIVAELAESNGLVAYLNTDEPTAEDAAEGKLASTWVVMARTPEQALIADSPGWERLGHDDDAPLWTDNYSDLLHVFEWNG